MERVAGAGGEVGGVEGEAGFAGYGAGTVTGLEREGEDCWEEGEEG